MRVLINTPDLNLEGGVSAHYWAVRPYLPPGVEYFTVGMRPGKSGGGKQILRLASDYWRYFCRVRSGGYSLLQLNPSLGMKALLRDGVFLLIGKALRKRVVLFVHGWDPECERLIRARFAGLFRTIVSRADGMIVLAREFQSRLRDLGYKGPIFVETTAVDESLAKVENQHRDGTRFRVLYLARVERDKGIIEAIEAYAQAKARHAGMEMLVAGDGSLLEEAREYTRARGIDAVNFRGQLSGSEKIEAFRNSDCYLLPTYHEGMPVSVLEAMTYGLPVVTRPVGGVKDFFKHGEMGFLEPSNSPKAFAEWLCRLAGDGRLCKEISKRNRAFAREHFAASKVASRMGQIHTAILTSASTDPYETCILNW